MSFKKLLADKLPSFVIDSLKKVLRKDFKNITKVSELVSPYLPQVTCIDVGASYYPHVKWHLFLNSENTQWIAVEPNAENLFYVDDWKNPAKIQTVETGLSQAGGPQTLYVTNIDSGSSLLEPVIHGGMEHRINESLKDYLFPFERVIIDTLTIADVMKLAPVGNPIIVKLDTQGTELSILRGAKKYFSASRVVGVEMESTLLAQPLMNGSAKFWEACEYLEEQGFELIDINVIRAPSKTKAKAKTYLNECDAVFALRRDIAALLPTSHRIALLSFYLSYDLLEEAISIFEDDTEIQSFFASNGGNPEVILATMKRLT